MLDANSDNQIQPESSFEEFDLFIYPDGRVGATCLSSDLLDLLAALSPEDMRVKDRLQLKRVRAISREAQH